MGGACAKAYGFVAEASTDPNRSRAIGATD